MRELAFDTETTGLDPDSGHKIIEIGLVELWQRLPTGRTFHHYLNPGRDIPAESTAIHGITAERVKDAPRFADIAAELCEFIGEDGVLVAHNAGFDMKFLNTELGGCGCRIHPHDKVIDTAAMARRLFPGAPASLDALCRRYEIDLSARSFHGALLDAQLLAEVYLELTGGRQASLLLEKGVTIQMRAKGLKRRISARRFEVPEEELAAHAGFVAQIKDAIWNRLSA